MFGRTIDKKPNEDLMTYLRVQLAEAINLEDRSLSTQLHETMRCIKELPPNRYNILSEQTANKLLYKSMHWFFIGFFRVEVKNFKTLQKPLCSFGKCIIFIHCTFLCTGTVQGLLQVTKIHCYYPNVFSPYMFWLSKFSKSAQLYATSPQRYS